jgi:hypothetical protein
MLPANSSWPTRHSRFAAQSALPRIVTHLTCAKGSHYTCHVRHVQKQSEHPRACYHKLRRADDCTILLQVQGTVPTQCPHMGPKATSTEVRLDGVVRNSPGKTPPHTYEPAQIVAPALHWACPSLKHDMRLKPTGILPVSEPACGRSGRRFLDDWRWEARTNVDAW